MADHARVLRKNGKRADAQRLLEQAWELARSRRGLDDADTLKAASRYAEALLEEGNVRQAEQLLNLVLPRCETALGRDHPTTQAVQDLVARVSSRRAVRPVIARAIRSTTPDDAGSAGRIGSDVASQPDARELPARLGGEEVAVSGPDVRSRRAARAAPQNKLVAHELAVVLAERPGGRAKTAVGRVRALRPFPDIAEELHGRCARRGLTGAHRVSRMESTRLQEVPLQGDSGGHGRRLPFRLGGQPGPRPAGEGVGFVVADMADRLVEIQASHAFEGEDLRPPAVDSQ